ncbi:MAG: aminodeoxychorismate lyase [Methylobacter sp.]|nr:MAG: aminodeoxychorismate lyase [Methylobacter sp.]
MILINGESKEHIEVSDRGLQYGDGLFETIAVQSGKTQFLDRHLQRLNAGCSRLLINPPDTKLLKHEVASLANKADRAVVKIIVTRGAGGRGYRQPDVVKPTRIVSLHPYPDYPNTHQEQGIHARFCTTRLGLNPALAGIKHLNRLEQVLARAEWHDLTIQEGIMLDSDGYVVEGTMTNLFFVKDEALYTASLEKTGVAGIIRGVVIEQAALTGIKIYEGQVSQGDVLSADEVFVCNSVIGIWPIRQIEHQQFSVGPLTRQFQHWLEHFEDKSVQNEQ